MMTLQSIARALGGVVMGGQVQAPGPGHSKADRSLTIFPAPNSPAGFRVHSHAGDDWRQCLAYVRARLGILKEPRRQAWPGPASTTVNPTDGDNIARALQLWSEARAPGGTPVETYLASRGLKLATAPEQGHVLRFHDGCPFRLENGSTARLPAMVAVFRDIATDAPCGIHRTALRPDGSGKADMPGLGNSKKMLGRAKGAAVKLSHDEDVTQGLAIAEGIETALSIGAAGWRPIWAMGSAGAIAKFPVLAGVEALTIFADADGTGVKAAKMCQAHWADAGQECTIILPPTDGIDWNDVAGMP